MTDERRMVAMASQMAQEPTSAGEGVSVPRKRTTVMQRTLVLMLRDASPDLPLTAIAQQVGISESSVRRFLAYRTEDVKASTRQLLQTMLPEAAGYWLTAAKVASKKGYHQPSKDLIEAAGGIEPKAGVSANVSVSPTVVLNMPFALGALTPQQPTAIEAQVVPQLPPKDAA